MNRFYMVMIVSFLLVAAPVVGAADKDADNVRLVTTGEILKIDAKKKTMEFRIILDAFPRGGGGYGGPRGGGRGGRIGGRGGYPSRYPQDRGNVLYIPTLDVKVFISDKAVVKVGHASADLSAFKAGDRITLTGVHRGKGTDIDAIEVSK